MQTWLKKQSTEYKFSIPSLTKNAFDSQDTKNLMREKKGSALSLITMTKKIDEKIKANKQMKKQLKFLLQTVIKIKIRYKKYKK